LSILKINEKKLLESRDDDIFMTIIKNYFARLGEFDSPESPSSTDIETMTGSTLFEYTLTLAYGVYAGMITTRQIETLRSIYRMQVVHRMDASNRISQTRTLEESVSLSVVEVGIVYDQVQYVEFGKEEQRQHMDEFNRLLEMREAQEDEIRNMLAAKGGWGLIGTHIDVTRAEGYRVEDRSAISLRDFRKIFTAVSPWKSSGRKGSRRPSMTEEEWKRVTIVDRIYCYSSVHFKMARKGRNEARPNVLHGDGYVVDLATVVQVLVCCLFVNVQL
jgi:hypothetical protein